MQTLKSPKRKRDLSALLIDINIKLNTVTDSKYALHCLKCLKQISYITGTQQAYASQISVLPEPFLTVYRIPKE